MVRRARVRAVLTRHGWPPTLALMGRKKSWLDEEYTTGSFKAGMGMVIAIVVVITLIWLAYGWALGQPGAPAAP